MIPCLVYLWTTDGWSLVGTTMSYRGAKRLSAKIKSAKPGSEVVIHEAWHPVRQARKR